MLTQLLQQALCGTSGSVCMCRGQPRRAPPADLDAHTL